MQIFIQHNGQQTGPFSPDQVRFGLLNGTYQSSDMAWYEGAAGWLPLSTIPGIAIGGPPGLPGASSNAQTSGLAIWSLVLGILSFLTVGLTGLPAVICGHLALGKIKRSAGTQSGGGLAIAGLVTGYLGFFILGIALLAGLAAPLVIRQRKKADQSEAVSNARQIGLALFEFQSAYGSLPDDKTAVVVAENTGTPVEKGSSSNARFRQLIRAQVAQSEMLFYAHAEGMHKPDNRTDGSHALESGECAFAYLECSEDPKKASHPIAIAPFVPGTHRFDSRAFDGKAVVVWSDNSVRSLPIDRITGKALLDGKDLLDPANPIWSGKPPVIDYPE